MTTTIAKQARVSELQAQATEAKAFWRHRNAQWRLVRAMIAGSYKVQRPGFELFQSNEAKTLTDLGVAIISGKPPIWRMPTKEDIEERERTSKSERLLDGIMREVSRTHRRRLHHSWLVEFAWYVCTGGYAVFPFIADKGDGDLAFRCELWDPMDVYPIVGSDGLEAGYRVYTTSKAQALSMAKANDWDWKALQERFDYRSKIAEDTLEVVNCWYLEDGDVVNGVIMDGVLVKEPVQEEQYSRIPVITGPSNGVPFRDFEQDNSFPVPHWQEQWGEALIGANMETYRAMDRLLTWKMEIARKQAYGLYEDVNEQGIPTVDPARLNEIAVIPRHPGESFRRVVAPEQGREANELLTYWEGASQRGGLSHVASGSLGINISGVTLQQLLTATRTKLLPYIATSQDVLSEIAMEFLDQFKNLGGKVSLEVRAREQGPGMGYLIEDFQASDLPKTSYVEVILPLSLPDDTMERIVAARQALGSNAPILDMTTVLDRLMQVQDPETVMARMDEDMSRSHPAMVAFRMVYGMEQKAKDLEIRATLNPLEKEEMLTQANLLHQLAQMTLQQVASSIAGNGGGPNAQGTPAKQAEPPPDVQPAEAGPFSPDQLNTIFRRPAPASTPTQPVTMADRLRNMGLVLPGGQ